MTWKIKYLPKCTIAHFISPSLLIYLTPFYYFIIEVFNLFKNLNFFISYKEFDLVKIDTIIINVKNSLCFTFGCSFFWF